jgi:hypothetical protein
MSFEKAHFLVNGFSYYKHLIEIELIRNKYVKPATCGASDLYTPKSFLVPLYTAKISLLEILQIRPIP